MKTRHFHTKLPHEKPLLRQIERWVQNGPIAKNGVLPVTTLFFQKFCFSLRTSYKELIWCTNYPNAHIHTFRKHWSFVWQSFFPVSNLKKNKIAVNPHEFLAIILDKRKSDHTNQRIIVDNQQIKVMSSVKLLGL